MSHICALSGRPGQGGVGKRLTVTLTGSKRCYATVKRTSGFSRPVYVPGSPDPISEWNCPAWAPIKGNASSHIYHLPDGAYYGRTKPEVCFSIESAARAAGYRKSKR